MYKSTPTTLLALLGCLLSLAAAQFHPMITAPAALAARATTGGDCDKSIVPWMSCAGQGMSSDLCMGNGALTAINTACGCSQATSLYDCYTKFCSMGPEYATYYTGISYCAAGGFGKPVPAPTGEAAKFADGGSGSGSGTGKPNAGAPGFKAGEFGLWAVWGLVATGAFVGMLI